MQAGRQNAAYSESIAYGAVAGEIQSAAAPFQMDLRESALQKSVLREPVTVESVLRGSEAFDRGSGGLGIRTDRRTENGAGCF